MSSASPHEEPPRRRMGVERGVRRLVRNVPDAAQRDRFRILHVVRRAWERYGLELDEATVRLWDEWVGAGGGMVLVRYAGGRIVEFPVGTDGGTIVRAAYHEGRGVTTLYPRTHGCPNVGAYLEGAGRPFGWVSRQGVSGRGASQKRRRR